MNLQLLFLSSTHSLVIKSPFLTTSPANERLVDSCALWNYKLCSSNSLTRTSSPMSSTGITNCTSRHSVLCVQKGRAEALKDTVGLGRNGRSRLEQRSARVNQIRVSPRVSCDRRGKLDVEDCSSECLYLYGGYRRVRAGT